MESIEFLRLELHGSRFDGGEIPLEVLGDLIALQEMVLDVAKWRYLQENPHRQRAPRSFKDRVTLKLTGLERGSAVSVISLSPAQPSLIGAPFPYQHYFETALENIAEVIAFAEQNGHQRADSPLPRKHLAYFDKIGRSLRDGECLVLPTARRDTPARLTKELRQKLMGMSRIREFTGEITLRGSISEVDQEEMTFELQPVHGRKITGPISEQHHETILEAFTGYRARTRVIIYGIGRYNQQYRLTSLESIGHIDVLDPLDVPARLDELRDMKDGWLDGEGFAPPPNGLDWLSATFNRHYPDTAHLPRIYPTEEGGVRMEWSHKANAIILDIDLNVRTGDWLWFDRNSDGHNERLLNLDDPAAWSWVASEIADKVSEQK